MLPHSEAIICQIIRIERVIKEPIDENNSLVIKLMSAGYTVDQCIDAVDRCGSLEYALNYLELPEDDVDIEKDLIPTSSHSQFSREGANFNMDW